MDHSERFQSSLDRKTSLTLSFNPKTKQSALGKYYFLSTSFSALASSSWWGKRWFYLEPPPSSHINFPASSPSRITSSCFHSPRHLVATLPTMLAGTTAESSPGWCIYLKWSVVAGGGKRPWWGFGGITPPLCAKEQKAAPVTLQMP